MPSVFVAVHDTAGSAALPTASVVCAPGSRNPTGTEKPPTIACANCQGPSNNDRATIGGGRQLVPRSLGCFVRGLV